MKFPYLSSALLPVILLAITACGKQSNLEEEAELSSFKANPQELSEKPVGKLAIGDEAPFFNLPDVYGKYVSLDNYEDAEVLVINFTCNHCPTAQAYEDRYIQVVKDYSEKNVAFIGISSNSPIGISPEELGYTDLSDDYESMLIRYEDKGYNFPYLYDGDEHKYSLAYGPTATPHIFVFDKEKKLTYSGRIDASEKPGTANAEDLRMAIDKTLSGESINPEQAITPAFGCSMKWAWKNEYTARLNSQWEEKQVDLEMISAEGLQDLLKNDTDELLLINFWATWCGPCVVEYPEFLEIQRMYGKRDFRFVSLSMDSPDHEDKVLKFLMENFSAVPNYLVDTDDKYAIINVVQNEWDGSLPITLLIEPGGKLAYKSPGEINPLELKRAIVDHPMIGRYY
jgi:thiol-disulfide isomerase/thioredoxin